MVTLLASITGFIGSFLPEIIKYYRDREEKKHELSLLDRRIRQSKNAGDVQLADSALAKESEEKKVLYSTYNSGIVWVDSLNSSVRPVLAYAFFFMYISVKVVQCRAISKAAPLIEYINVLWSLEDHAIFAGITSFYFGQRTFGKFLRK